MTTGYVVPPPRNAWVRGWRAFVRWCRGRPFWGGLLTILSAVIYFYSGHLGFAGIKISFSQQEFLGWMIPLILVLCGILLLITPAQRIFYGVLASAVSVGGLVGLNLGGFLIGMLVGIVGGALGASWTPSVQPAAPAWPGGTAASDADAGVASQPIAELDELLGRDGTAGQDEPTGHDGSAGQDESAGHDGSAWRRSSPAHAAPEPEPGEPAELRSTGPLADTLPTSTVSPLGVPARTTAPPPRSGAVPSRPATQTPGGQTAGGADRPGSLRPGVQPADDWEDDGEDDGDGEPPSGGGTLPRRSPRGLAVILVLLTVAAVGATTLHLQTPAGAAPSCAELFDSLTGSGSPTPSAEPNSPEPTGGTAAQAASDRKSTGTGKPKRNGSTVAAGTVARVPAGPTSAPPAPVSAPASSAPAGSDSDHSSLGGAVLGVLDGLGKLLGIGDDGSSPAPSASASPVPSDSPTASPRPTPTSKPTGTGPTGTPKAPTPSVRTTAPATHPSSTGKSAVRAATASPSSTACPVGSTDPVAPLDQTVVAVNPAEQITALLVQIEMTYRGVTTLPTANGGKVRVLQFTMASSSSTPFELRVPMVSGNHTLSYKSTKLTVSGHVTFYTSRITGNLLGALPVTFTPDAPPPLPPITVPLIWFTNATLDLVLVHADQLTAPALDISYLS